MRKSRSGNVLVIERQGIDQAIFKFRSKRWALITIMLSVIVGFGLYAVADQSKYPQLLRILGIISSVLFAYSSIYSFFAVRTLVIDGANNTIKYTRKDFMHNQHWEHPFEYFKELRIFRNPISTSAGKSAFLRLSLVDKQGNYIILGTSELGIFGKSRAEEIGEYLSGITALPLIIER